MVAFTEKEGGFEMFSFRKPFSAQVWFAVAVTILFSAVTYFFIVKLEEVGTDDFEENA